MIEMLPGCRYGNKDPRELIHSPAGLDGSPSTPKICTTCGWPESCGMMSISRWKLETPAGVSRKLASIRLNARRRVPPLVLSMWSSSPSAPNLYLARNTVENRPWPIVSPMSRSDASSRRFGGTTTRATNPAPVAALLHGCSRALPAVGKATVSRGVTGVAS